MFLDFHYMNRSEPDSNDVLFVRGDDTKPWVRLYDLFANREMRERITMFGNEFISKN